MICGAGWIIRATQLHRKVRPVGQTDPDQPRSEEITKIGDLLARNRFQEGYDVVVPATKKKIKARIARPAALGLVLDAASQSVQHVGQDERSGLHPHDGCGGLRGQTPPRSEAAEMGALHPRCRPRRTGRALGRPGLRATPDDRRLPQGNQDRLPAGGAAIPHCGPLGTRCGCAVGRGGASLADSAIARVEPERAAQEIAPQEWVNTLYHYTASKSPKYAQRWTPANWTVLEFMRRLAGLGGFLGRKGDGVPGWITLWRGVSKLLLLIEGRQLGHKKCG